MSDCAACQPNVEGVAHTCGVANGGDQGGYQRTGLRVRIHEPPYHYDLDSFEVGAADVSRTAHELRLAAMRLKRAAEERERAYDAHDKAMRAFTDARNAYEVSRGNMSYVEAGNVLGSIKDLPLPEERKR